MIKSNSVCRPNSPIQKADFGRRFGDYIVRVKDGFVVGVTILDATSHLRASVTVT